MKQTTVVVLGANGLVGHTVYSFLNSRHLHVIGTDRKDSALFEFDALDPVRSLKRIYTKYPSIDYVINCIGILKPLMDKIPIEDALFINGIFPHIVAAEALKKNTRLIHVSTDAVFDDMSGVVDEDSQTHPADRYGISKLLGEPFTKNALTVRTSIIGNDPVHKRGLVEWVRNLPDRSEVAGYAQQQWSGCTSSQFAQLCDFLIQSDKFDELTNTTNTIHFAPITSTKYDLIVTLVKSLGKKITITKSETPIVTRKLVTKFVKEFGLDTFSNQTVIS